MISITMDGRKLEVPEGITVLRAAKLAGIEIPTLCDHPHLTPYGGCRLCVVEVEGARALQTSCTLPVTNGMVVRTNTEKVRQARNFILTLLFSERNHFCMVCQVSGGDCELQNSALAEGMTHWPMQPNWQSYPVDTSHKYLVLDNNRCILCRRCVRACGELVGNFTLGIEERGANSLLIADYGVPWGQSTCVSCGTCAQVCPTGALIDRASAYHGHEADVERIDSICMGCSVGCGVELVTRDNHLLRIDGDWNAPVNGGILCEKGRFQPLAEVRERITAPLLRKNGAMTPATWEEALNTVAARLKPLASKNGHGIAALASTRLQTESLYLFKQIFAEKLGSEMVTSIEEGLTGSLPGPAGNEADRPPEGSLDALKTADCTMTIGVNPIYSHQVAGFFVKRNLPHGMKLVVVDPQENPLHLSADYALRPRQGTDYELLLSLINAVVRLGLAKTAPDARYDLAAYSPEAVSQTTGIPADTIIEVARLIATSQRPAFLYGKGITRGDKAQALQALIELGRLVGAVDRSHSAVIGVKGQANSLAAELYGLDKSFEPEGREAIYLALGDDTPSQRLIQRLQGARFLVVQASYASPATDMADVVLPVEMWVEQQGHFLNLEGRLQAAHRALTPPDHVWSNCLVLEMLAEKMKLSVDANWKAGLRNAAPPVIAR